jgi:hypothetical protein
MKYPIIILLCVVWTFAAAQAPHLTGAWESGPEDNHIVMIVSGQYFTAAVYNKKTGAFIGTCGGKWRIEKGEFIESHEFNTMKPELIGTELQSKISLKGNSLQFATTEKKELFQRIDDGKPGQLAGAWLITGLMTDTGMRKMVPGVRKTMKVLSGTRFQWIAYNSETKEFSGTGGGTYTTIDGKYTENIEFFSRDNSRVGMSLKFDYAIENGDWHHKGLSSKGAPVDELWTQREKLVTVR